LLILIFNIAEHAPSHLDVTLEFHIVHNNAERQGESILKQLSNSQEVIVLNIDTPE